MKTTRFSILVGLLAIFTIVPNTFAQDYTTLELPEGAKARLGKGKINEIKYSPDGTRLAVVSAIGIWIYDAQTDEALELIKGHTAEVNSVAFSSDGNTLASGSADSTIRLWDANTGSHLHTLTGHTKPGRNFIRSGVLSVAFSPDSTIIASGSTDNTVRLWDTNTGLHLRTLTGHTAGVNSVAFHPDGATLASGSWDRTARLWNVKHGFSDLKTGLPGHTFRVISVAFSSNGALPSQAQAVTALSVSGMQTRGAVSAHSLDIRLAVINVSFSPDGQHGSRKRG